MGLTARGARTWRARSRAGIALVVLSAWFGTLLVAAPTITRASASSTADPSFSAPPARGITNAPLLAFTANGASDPVECGWGTSPSTAPTSWAACTSPYQPTLTDAEGAYDIWIRSVSTPVDPGLPDTPTVGFDSTPVPSDGVATTYVIDRTDPVVSLTSAPSAGPTATEGWVFTADEPAAVTCVLSGAASAGPAPCGTGSVFPGGPLGDGSYTITATATDVAGNTGTASTTYDRDTTGPALTLASGPTGRGSSAAPGWTVTADAAEPVDCSVTRDGAAVPALDGRCDGGGYPAAGLGADGTYVLSATASDALGNVTTKVMGTYVLDRVAPVLTVGATDATSPDRPSWDVAVVDDEAGVAAQCRLTGTAGAGPYDSGLVACGPTYVAPVLAEGSYTLTVTATDGAGNPALAVTRSYTYDVTAPGAPLLGGDAGYTRTGPLSWTVAAADSGTDHIVCTVTAPDSTTTTTNPCGPTVTAAVLPADEGLWTLSATAVDASGNTATATRSVIYDHTLNAIVVAPKPAPARQPVWHVTVDADATATCSMAGIAAAVDCTNTDVTVDLTGQPGAVYTLVVDAVDAAGNTTSTSVEHVLAPDAPAVSVVARGRSLNPTWTISAQPDATLACTLVAPDASRTPATPCANGTVAPSLSGPDGTWNLEVVATISTPPGTTSSAVGSSPAGYVLDTTAPGDPAISATPSGPQNTATADWTVTAAAGTTRVDCDVLHDGALALTVPSCETAGVSLTFAPADEGTWQVKATAYDLVGNASNVVPGPVVTYDVTPPGAPDVLPLASPSNDPSPTWTITSDVGTSLECAWTTGSATPTAWFACATPAVLDVPAPANDGTYTLHARATDDAGNTGPEDSQDYELDRAAPAAPTFSTPTSPGSSAAVSWTLDTATEISPTLECRLEVDTGAGAFGVVPGQDWAACTSPFAATLPAEGGYRAQSRVTDRAGNLGPVGTTATYTYDKTPPQLPAVTGPTGPSQTSSVTWTITPAASDGGTAFECRFVENGAEVGTFSPCGTTVTRSGLADGRYAVEVQAVDGAGNISTPFVTSPTYVVDTAGPGAPTFAGADGTGNVTSTSWSFSGEGGSTPKCRLYRNGIALGAAAATCASGDAFALTAGDGTYRLEVGLVDAAGNAGPLAMSPAYLLDTQSPAVPDLHGPTGTANTTTAQYVFTAEAGAVPACRLLFAAAGSAAVPAPVGAGGWSSCASPWDVPLTLGDGRYRAEVHVTDAAGNVSPDAQSEVYALDTTGPLAPTFTAQPTGTDNITAVAWDWSGETPSTGTCTLSYNAGGGSATSVAAGPTACNSGTFATTLAAGDGVYQLSVQLTDPQGNAGAVAVSTAYTLDASAPSTPTVTGPSGTSNVTSADYDLSSAVEPGATAECRLTRNTTTVVDDWAPCTLPRTISLPGDGSYVLHVRLTDQYGNLGPVGASPAYLLDTQLPAAPDLHGPTGSASTTTAQYTFTAEAASLADCRLLFVAVGSAGPPAPVGAGTWSACTSPWTVPLTLGDGSYQAEAHVTDAAGNVSLDAQSEVYTLDTTGPVAATFTAEPTGTDNVDAVSWSWTGETPTTGSCTLTRTPVGSATAAVVAGPVACNAGSYATTLADGDGFYQLSVQLTDPQGNAGAVAVSTGYTLDATAPGAPTVNGPTGTGNTTSVDYTITSAVEALSTQECRLSRASTVVQDWAPCTLPRTIALPGDGSYVLEVRLTDQYGSLGAVGASPAYLLDTVAPALPDLHGPTGTANTTTAQYTFTSEAASSADCRQLFVPAGSPGAPAPVGAGGWAPCASPWDVPLTLGDGSYQAEVHVTDLAGNVSPDAQSETYALDTTGPAAPTFTAEPTGSDNVAAVTWTWSGETPSTGTCTLTRTPPGSTTPAVVAGPAACSTGTYATTLADGDGSYQLSVRLTDPQSNPGAVAVSVGYTLDLSAPVAPTVTGPGGTSNATTASYDVSSPVEPTATAECRLTRDATTVVEDWAGCTLPRSIALSGDGSYVLEVRLTDQYGNLGAAGASPAYLLDTVAPALPDLHGPSGSASTATVPYTFSAEPASAAECRLLFLAEGAAGAPAPVGPGAWSPCASPWTVALTLGDGSYQAEVHVTDAAGNVSPDAQSEVYTLDTTGPLAATFTAQPTGTAKVKDVSWAWTGETPSTGVCTLTHTAVGASAASVVAGPLACDSGVYATTLTYGDGLYQLSVQLTDPQGNAGPVAVSTGYALDATSPAAPIVTGPGGTSNATTALYDLGSAVESGATAECRLTRDTTTVIQDWVPCTLPRSIPLSGDGSYVLQVRLTDQYGNLGPAGASPAYLLDTKLPASPTVIAPSSPSAGAAPTFTISTDSDTTTTCRLARGSVAAVDTTSCSGSFTPSLAGMPDGEYVLTVVATDPAGNTAAGTSAGYVFDTTAPAAPVVSGPAGPSQNQAPSFGWTGELGARSECSLQEKAGATTAFTGCSAPYAPALAADGSWVLSVRLVDAAGNTSAVGSSGAYLLDTTPPATPVVSAPTSPGRDLAPSWSADAEEGSTTECRLSGPGQLGAWGACTLPLRTPLSGDGAYVFDVRATDAALNVSPIGTGSYTLDTTAPGVPVVTPPASPGRSRTPSISFVGEPGTTGSCRLTRGSTVVSDSAPCVSPATLDLTGLPDGAYTLSVRAEDPAGNIGPAATGTYVLDTTAPTAPTFTLVAGSPSSDPAPVFGFNAELGTTLSCKVTTPGGAVRDLGCASPLTVDLGGAPDGDYVLTVRATDPAGNVGPPATTTYHLDSTAPMAPKVVGPVTPGAGRAPVWRISSTSPTECRLTRGTTVVRDWAGCGTSYAADLYGQPDGPYILEVRVVGTTAPTSSRYRLDTAAPSAATLVGPPSPGTGLKPTWAVSSSDTTVRAECRVMVFTGVLKDWAPCAVSAAGSLFALDLTGLGDGTYTLVVRLTDAAGNLGPNATSDYVLDRSAPAAVGVIAPPSPGNDTTPTWTLTSAAGVKLECRLTSGQKVISDFAPCAGTFTADLTGLPDGAYTLTVHALSAAGTPGPDSTSSYILDTTAAGAPGTLSGPTGPSRDRAPKWTFSLAPGTTATCKVTFGGKVFRDGPCTSPFVLDLSNAADGTYTLTVRAVDAAGNLGSPSTAGYILKTTPPPPPVLTMQPGSPSSTTNPRWGFSLFRGTTAQCRLLQGGAPLEDWTACTSPVAALLSGKPDGRYTMQVRGIDLALNTSAVVSGDYTFDRTAAPLAEFLDTPATPGNDLTPTWVVAAPESATPTAPALVRTAALTGTPQTECRLTTPRGVGSWAPCAGSFTATTNGDGTYLLEVRAFDAAGDRGPASSSAYLLDTRAPAAPRFTDPVPPAVGNDAEVAWSWADDENLVQCRILRNGAQLGVFIACDPPRVFDIGRLGEATYSIEARAVDAAGNVSATTIGSYRYDVTPPAAPTFASRPAARGASTSASWTFAVPLDTSALCVVTRNGTVVSEGACAGAFTLDLRNQQPATWALSVHFVDAAGNAGPSTVGTYTLTSAGGRGRVDGPSGIGGGSPGAPGPGAGGVPAPGGLGAPGSPTSVRDQLNDHPRAGAVPRIPDVVKKGIKAVARATGAIPGALPGTDVPKAIKNALGQTITKPQLPLALFIIVLLFLLVQNRIDRRDPKLAIAPTSAEPELTFGPIFRPGGASA